MYFTGRKDFSLRRIVGMLVRINFFPLLLVATCRASLVSDYYVVPLHTIGFFIVYYTVKNGLKMEESDVYKKYFNPSNDQSPKIYGMNKALLITLIFAWCLHFIFWELFVDESLAPTLKSMENWAKHRLENPRNPTFLPETTLYLSKQLGEVIFRFGLDRYTVLIGMTCAFTLVPLMNNRLKYMADSKSTVWVALYNHVIVGSILVGGWWWFYGHEKSKFIYNPYHPYVGMVPVVGYSIFLYNQHGAQLIYFITF